MKTITLLVSDEDYPSWERALRVGSEVALTAHLRTGTLNEFIDWGERAQAESSRQLRVQGPSQNAAEPRELQPPPKDTTSFDLPDPQAPLDLLLRIRNIKRIDPLPGGLVRIHHNRKNADRIGMAFEVMAAVRKYLDRGEEQRRQTATIDDQRRLQEAWAQQEGEAAPLIRDDD